MRDLVLKYNGILGLISCNRTAQIIAKSSTSLQLSVSDTLTHVNFPTFAKAESRYGGLIRADTPPWIDDDVYNIIVPHSQQRVVACSQHVNWTELANSSSTTLVWTAVLEYVCSELTEHMLTVLILPAYKWLPPFAADV